MICVAQGFHDKILWDFMSVYHTKFHPVEGFGHIRKHVGRRVNVQRMTELMTVIKKSARSNDAILFPVDKVVDWNSGMRNDCI